MNPTGLLVVVFSALIAFPSTLTAQKDGAPRRTPTPATTKGAPATAPATTPAASPAAAPAATGRYTWCSALTAPPLQRLFSGVFLAPADTTIDLTAGFVNAIKAKHHPNPQDVQCKEDYSTREGAEQARRTKMPADIVWRLPVIAVDWVYVAP